MAIRQLGKNKYQLIVDYYDDEGKRRKHTKVVNCKGKKAAKDLLDEFADSWADALPDTAIIERTRILAAPRLFTSSILSSVYILPASSKSSCT